MIWTDLWRSEPPCVYPPDKAGHMAKRRVGVEYSPSMLEPVRPGAVSPERAMCLPTFSHFVMVNKASLSDSLSFLLLCLFSVPFLTPSRAPPLLSLFPPFFPKQRRGETREEGGLRERENEELSEEKEFY